jgi:hypothetical protein
MDTLLTHISNIDKNKRSVSFVYSNRKLFVIILNSGGSWAKKFYRFYRQLTTREIFCRNNTKCRGERIKPWYFIAIIGNNEDQFDSSALKRLHFKVIDWVTTRMLLDKFPSIISVQIENVRQRIVKNMNKMQSVGHN